MTFSAGEGASVRSLVTADAFGMERPFGIDLIEISIPRILHMALIQMARSASPQLRRAGGIPCVMTSDAGRIRFGSMWRVWIGSGRLVFFVIETNSSSGAFDIQHHLFAPIRIARLHARALPSRYGRRQEQQ
jgi:hypothetical protein